jgi:hypothetical protein
MTPVLEIFNAITKADQKTIPVNEDYDAPLCNRIPLQLQLGQPKYHHQYSLFRPGQLHYDFYYMDFPGRAKLKFLLALQYQIVNPKGNQPNPTGLSR